MKTVVITGSGRGLGYEMAQRFHKAGLNVVLNDINATSLEDAREALERMEGTGSSPVGYLEGIYVTAAYRKQGVARELLAACESWAKAKGCTDFASDCELDNVQSLQFHLNMGFEEANRIICFTKKL